MLRLLLRIAGPPIQNGVRRLTEGWHDAIPALEKTPTDDDLVSVAKEFLEPQLATGWEPSPGKNRCEIPYGVMEHRVLNGSFF
jgi:hypothetical protein